MTVRILTGDALAMLRTLESESIQCVVTSPPYWALRAYGTTPVAWGGDPEHDHVWGPPLRAPWANEVPGQNTHGKNDNRNWSKQAGSLCACRAWLGELGQEPTPELYVEHIVQVLREVRRVLRGDGTLWLNIGDSYSGSGKGPGNKANGKQDQETRQGFKNRRSVLAGLKPKDLVGIPWMIAFALRTDGWYLRQDIIWAKPNPMPESVRDRCTKAHEYVFLFSKAERYFFDAEAIKEPASGTAHARGNGVNPKAKIPSGWDTGPGGHSKTNGRYRPKQNESFSGAVNELVSDRNKRSVWTIRTEPFPESHFATFPTALPEICIKAGTSEFGACRACGAPWGRKLERTPMLVREGPGRRGLREAATGATKRTAVTGTMLQAASSRTIGWTPTCDCPPSEPVPCVVLDPFGGAGTTGLVADRLGRDAVLVDLNPKYVEIARRRLETDAPMLTEPVAVVPAPAQLALLSEASGS